MPSRGRGAAGDGAEVAAILGRADADGAPEGAVHRLHATESAGRRDLGHAAVGGLEQAARPFDALRLHVRRGGDADLAPKGAGERPVVAWRMLRPATIGTPLEVTTAPASGATTEIS
jgi:hypothetical protein